MLQPPSLALPSQASQGSLFTSSAISWGHLGYSSQSTLGVPGTIPSSPSMTCPLRGARGASPLPRSSPYPEALGGPMCLSVAHKENLLCSSPHTHPITTVMRTADVFGAQIHTNTGICLLSDPLPAHLLISGSRNTVEMQELSGAFIHCLPCTWSDVDTHDLVYLSNIPDTDKEAVATSTDRYSSGWSAASSPSIPSNCYLTRDFLYNSNC